MTDHLSDHVVGLYERFAFEWDVDRNSAGWNDRIWHQRFADALGPEAKVLDIGCGSGRPVAVALAARGFRLTGVDSSPAMIALCKSRMPEHEWIVADMRGLVLGRRFDAVLAWDSFFFLPFDDQRRMFDVFAGAVAPGGLLMFNTGPGHGEAIGNYRGEPLYHASLAEDEYRLCLRQAGFDVMSHVVKDPAAGGRTVWLARAH